MSCTLQLPLKHYHSFPSFFLRSSVPKSGGEAPLTRHTPHATRPPDTPHATRHTSHVTRHVSGPKAPDARHVTSGAPQVTSSVPRIANRGPKAPDTSRVTSGVPRVTSGVPRAPCHAPRITSAKLNPNPCRIDETRVGGRRPPIRSRSLRAQQVTSSTAGHFGRSTSLRAQHVTSTVARLRARAHAPRIRGAPPPTRIRGRRPPTRDACLGTRAPRCVSRDACLGTRPYWVCARIG